MSIVKDCAGAIGGESTVCSRDRDAGPLAKTELDKGCGVLNLVDFGWVVIEPKRRFRTLAIVQTDPDGGVFAYAPALPGAVSQGDTLEEVLRNLREALAGCIESYLSAEENIPWVPLEEGLDEEGILSTWISFDV